MEVRLELRKPIRVAFVRHLGPYQECGVAWEKLMAFAAQHGLLSPLTQRIGIGHDSPDETSTDKLRYDACLTVDDKFQATEGIGIQEIPGGEYAVVTHRGDYSGLADTYRRIFREWLPTSGRQLRPAPCFEIYVSDPATTRPEDLLTEVYVPLQSD